MVGQLMQTIQGDLSQMVIAAYTATNPSGPKFLVLDMIVADDGISIQTQAMPE
jgi:hypothetical protein